MKNKKNKVRLYLKTEKAFDPRELAELQKLVISNLAEDVSFEIIVTPNLPRSIDWRRHSGEPPALAAEARFLTNEIEGIEFFSGGNIGPGTNDKLISVDTVLNWIGHLGDAIPQIIPETERLQKHMLDVDDKWKHGSEVFVYKYCSWDVAKEFVLSGPKTLRFNDVVSMNDPLEFERFNINLYGGPADKDFPLRYWNLIHQATKCGIRYFCCSQDIASNFNPTTGYLGKGAIRGFAHPSMWNHYASQHDGVCLILKKSALSSAIETSLQDNSRVFSGSIRYLPNSHDLGFHKNIFPIIDGMENWTDEEIIDHLKAQAEENKTLLLFTKSQEWEIENEFRWAYIGDGEGPIDIPISDSLAGLVLGCDFNNEFHNDAAKLAGDNGIPVRRIWWKNGFACPPWPLDAFEGDGFLAKWSEQAAMRRANRQR